MLLADRYDDRTHFIFELLQNAEDALGRRLEQQVSRGIDFQLTDQALRLSHFGKLFDIKDVEAVCGIAMSTKDLTAIGRFGIGFKSVYTFTDRPEIHSGDEDFAIESFVLPVQSSLHTRNPDETIILLPFKNGDRSAYEDVSNGLKRLGASTLLFLRNIEEITWNACGEASGTYLRSKPVNLGPNVNRITVIGQESGELVFEQNWLVFDREVSIEDGSKNGRVEIAFLIVLKKDSPDQWLVQPVADSPLVVYFPTVLSTKLGFLVQGPYRTTPSRDNVPRHDEWNQLLVTETAALLVDSLRWMRDSAMLDTSALCCMPLDHTKFTENSMFAPLFGAVRTALATEPLLPLYDGGYAAASKSKLARTQELRELFNSDQIGTLFGDEDGLSWLSGDITADRFPELRQYLIRELAVSEITPEAILPKLDKKFLEDQSDEWVLRLYEFLSGQAALRRRLDNVPLIRLMDGSHVVAKLNGQSQAFLPVAFETDFPIMRREICKTSQVRVFLASLGITEPDPVDDVIWNILPRYRNSDVTVNDKDYAADIGKIRAAFNTDSKSQKEKLLSALRESTFVMAIDAGDGSKWITEPVNLYLATERLKQLFAGVFEIYIVDDSYDCLRGEGIRELLEACGAVRYPRPIEAPAELNRNEREELRKNAGHAKSSGYSDTVHDWILHGFTELIKLLPTLNFEDRIKRSNLIWDSLGDLEERRGRGVFEGNYTWTHNGSYKAEFPSAFLRYLNASKWVPDSNGEMKEPHFTVFETLGWKSNPFILSKIKFKPPIMEILAREAGIDSALLDLLKTLGVTSEADFKLRYGVSDLPTEPDNVNEAADADVYDDAKALWGDLPDIPNGKYDPDGDNDATRVNGNATSGDGKGSMGNAGSGDRSAGSSRNGGGTSGKRSPGSEGGRAFISYVGTHPNDDELDPDGLDQTARMQLEELAILKILAVDPKLKQTPANNPGYDLYENDINGNPIRWVEVKAMTGTLNNRPVGISHTQFEWARQHGSSFWLYIVEQVSNPNDSRILCIQDPVSQARTFTFDNGWVDVAKTL